MQKSVKRRVLGVLAVVLGSQLLSACVVLPAPMHRRGVVVQPGYGHGHGHHAPGPEYRDPYWRR